MRNADRHLTIMVSAGEASGDSHAANALLALREQGTAFHAFGMGAGALQSANVELTVDCRDLAVIGLVDVLANYHKFLQRLRLLRQTMLTRKPDLLLIVDYPDFNLKLAATAKKAGIPVLFYISPKVWAWRSGRVKRIASLVTHMAVLFPFEVNIYKRASVPVTYVGNPVVEDAVTSYSRDEACRLFGLDHTRQVIALLPGSRHGEIKRHLPVILNTVTRLQRNNSALQFLLPVAPTLTLDDLESHLGCELPQSITVTKQSSRDAMRAADVALVASGTATLETALIGTPMVVMYIISRLNYTLIKRLIRIPDISLVNIIAERRVVPEFVQSEATPEHLAEAVDALLHDGPYRQTMLDNLADVRKKMGSGGASKRVAQLIDQLTKPVAT